MLASPALAGPLVDRAVEALRDDPVYVDPQAERALSEREAGRLRERIATADTPIYVAVLPAAAGDASDVVREIRDELARDGTYAVVAGNQFRAASTELEVRELANDAINEHGNEGVLPTLLGFVDRVSGEEGRPSGEPAEDSDGSGVGTWILLGVGAGGIGFFALRRRRKKRVEQVELAEVKQEAQADLLALADDVRALDLDVEMPGADRQAKEDYATALTAYERADKALDRARSPDDLEAVSSALEEGRYAMASAKARLEGGEPPERRPPCFFDPRHGPSVEEAEWSPPGGAPRPVPVCAADAQRIADGLEPAAREVTIGGERRPYWEASSAYGPYAGGFFGGAGGLLPGLLIGSMLGGAWGAGPAYGSSGEDAGGDYGGGDLGGGGDFGGGDFGGGGGFGGGDFGGGGGGD